MSVAPAQDTKAREPASQHGRQPGGLGGRRVGLAVVCLALLSGFSTYLILTGLTPIMPTHGIVVSMLLINGLLIVAMLAMVGWQLRGLWRARKRQAAAARLHTRIVGLFSVIALMPAILLVIFATLSLDRGLDNWFSTRIQSIIANSIDVASAYVNEQGQVIRSDALGMARELESAVQLLSEDIDAFEKFLTAQAALRAIPVAYVIDGSRDPVAEASSRSEISYKKPPSQALEVAKEGRIVELALQSSGAVGALTKIVGTQDRYLYVIRPVNPKVLGHLRTTRANAAEYSQLEQRRAGIQVAFAAMFISISLTFLLAAIWAGLWFADRLVAPIRQLIDAAYEVSQGNLDVAVPPASKKEDDVGKLSTAFNRMTADLRMQRNELVNANTQLDERRRFTEAVLSGVTAGVIGLDRKGNVTLVNRSALELLKMREGELVGKPLEETLPDFAALMGEAKKQGKKPVQAQIKQLREDGERNFAVRFTREGSRNKDYGFVVTFDDITELVVAQRTSAWADVARRIAHEIKNPLTPIQLSAERIRRRYGDQISGDREVFDRCTETIVRHVGDIRRMVDEFSAFARMPKPVIEAHDINDVVREAVVLFQMSNSEFAYKLEVANTPLTVHCDRRLLSQAMTNLIKNASEAVESADQAQREAGHDYSGTVTARVTARDQSVLIEVIDNGCGLPKEDRHRLTEPYVTNRQKGTGLGLAIVQKIVEQHQGTLELDDADPAADEQAGQTRGARITITLPLSETASEGGGKTVEPDSGASQQRGARNTARKKQGVSHGI
jgi:two-component system, NtrC family, nitrogen regulation sensor histidine kinase NtrY